MIFNCIF